MNEVLELTKALINCRSVTPEDAGCQQIIAQLLRAGGFTIRHLPFGDVSNLYAVHDNTDANPLANRGGKLSNKGRKTGPGLLFAGHTDVVPEGPIQAWHTDPFQATVIHDSLFGRGAADMKSSLAAMVIAAIQFVRENPDHDGRLGLLITSDEEGEAIHGTQAVVACLQAEGQTWDYCVVGEPTSSEILGDTIKNGRRGSLNARLTVTGIQGHVAYPHLADNPVHKLGKAISLLSDITWDKGDGDFPATSLQFSNLQAGTGATNVIPGTATADFNLRFNPTQNEESIVSRINKTLNQNNIPFTIDWALSGNPFITRAGFLTDAVRAAIQDTLNIDAVLSTTGGTSDGRFIALTGTQVVEFGPINQSIHKVNENILLADLNALPSVYTNIINKVLL